MTEKPHVIPYIWCQGADGLPDNEKNEIIQEPTDTKRQEGWVLGEKPSHKTTNFQWNLADNYIHHENSWGIPIWDSETAAYDYGANIGYKQGSVVSYSPYIYKSAIDSPTQIPATHHSSGTLEWDIIGQFIQNMDDTLITTPTDNSDHLLIYLNDSGSGQDKWISQLASPIVDNLQLENISDISYSTSPQIGEVIAWNAEDRVFTNFSPQQVALMDNTSMLSDVLDIEKVVGNPPKNSILITDGNVWKMEPAILDESQWDKVTDKPDKYPIPYADEDVLGGVRVWSEGTAVYFESYPKNKPSKPTNLRTDSSSDKIILYWDAGDGELVYFYNVYRDNNVNLPYQSGVIDTVFFDTDVQKNREYWYTVKAVNDKGISESSEVVMGHTYVQPAPPTGLVYKINGLNVTLTWNAPVGDYGDLTYTVYRDNIEIMNTPSLGYIDYNVSIQTHTYYVIANNKAYSSDKSNTVTVAVV